MILVEKTGLVPGLLIERYKRFLADVRLADDSVVTAHTTNTGSMKTCWEPGDRVLLERAANPDRKLKFTWLAVERDGGLASDPVLGFETWYATEVPGVVGDQDCAKVNAPTLIELRKSIVALPKNAALLTPRIRRRRTEPHPTGS